jgi:hypothetical protein
MGEKKIYELASLEKSDWPHRARMRRQISITAKYKGYPFNTANIIYHYAPNNRH